jgi:hypothetical protein
MIEDSRLVVLVEEYVSDIGSVGTERIQSEDDFKVQVLLP